MQENRSITVEGAFKKYGNTTVLQGLNMNVEEGTIYSLLGPSGCGKTTLLTALLGRVALDAGSIRMSVNRIRDIGYMPQEVTLYEEFSIMEQMIFYGHLYSMKKSSINERTDLLLKLLELPEKNTVVRDMSGGEQRRVSLCVALLHNPRLLILDEPTVGLDVVLCDQIWKYLLNLSVTELKTVIITTHYIEEARNSNTIAIMRNGQILAENEPNHLMEINNCATLEEVFLKLCQENEFKKDVKHKKADYISNKPTKHLYKTENLNIYKLYAVMMKNIFWMKRNLPMMLFTLVLPIVQCTLISITVGEDPTGLKFGFVNNEATLRNSNCELEQISCTQHDYISCYFLKILSEKSIDIIEYENLNLAQKGVKRNDIWGCLYFNANYTEYLFKRFNGSDVVTDDIIDGSEVKVWLDMSNQVIRKVLEKHITRTMIELSDEIWKRCNLSMSNIYSLIKYKKPIYGATELSLRQFMTPANAVLFEFFLPLMFTVGAMLMEKTSGILERSLIAGLSLVEIAIGHIVLQLLILIIQTAFLFIVLYYLFDNPLEGNIILCLILLISVGICGMFYGFFITAICKSFTTASYIAVGSYFPLFLLSGAIWPVEGMDHVLRYASYSLPTTSSVESFRAISIKSWPITHPTVFSAFLSLFLWSTVLCFSTYMAIKCYGLKGN